MLEGEEEYMNLGLVGWLSCQQTDAILCGALPEICTECNAREGPWSWDLRSVSRRTRVEMGWEVGWNGGSSMCKGKEG